MRILIMLMRTGIWSLKFKFCRSKSCPSILYLPRKVIQCAGIGTLSLRKVLLPCKLQVMSSRNVPERRRVAPRGRILGDKYGVVKSVRCRIYLIFTTCQSVHYPTCDCICRKEERTVAAACPASSSPSTSTTLWLWSPGSACWPSASGSCWTASMRPTHPSPPPTHYSLGRP